MLSKEAQLNAVREAKAAHIAAVTDMRAAMTQRFQRVQELVTQELTLAAGISRDSIVTSDGETLYGVTAIRFNPETGDPAVLGMPYSDYMDAVGTDAPPSDAQLQELQQASQPLEGAIRLASTEELKRAAAERAGSTGGKSARGKTAQAKSTRSKSAQSKTARAKSK